MDLTDYVRRYGSVHGFPDISVIDECLVGRYRCLYCTSMLTINAQNMMTNQSSREKTNRRVTVGF